MPYAKKFAAVNHHCPYPEYVDGAPKIDFNSFSEEITITSSAGPHAKGAQMPPGVVATAGTISVRSFSVILTPGLNWNGIFYNLLGIYI